MIYTVKFSDNSKFEMETTGGFRVEGSNDMIYLHESKVTLNFRGKSIKEIHDGKKPVYSKDAPHWHIATIDNKQVFNPKKNSWEPLSQESRLTYEQVSRRSLKGFPPNTVKRICQMTF
jgi:hypothetical protein